MRAFFITGTDTGCGKTSVGCAIASELREAGRRVRVLKPIETGCALEDGERIALDARALARAADDPRSADEICPYRLLLPAAPQAAARKEGVTIDVEVLIAAFRSCARDADVVLVEGAGGLRVPIAGDLDMRALAARLELPLIVVARAALGTLNHTQLTLESAAAAGLSVTGVVVSHTQAELPESDLENLALLGALPSVRLLGELAHGAARISPPIAPALGA